VAGRIRGDADAEAIAYSISALGFSAGFVYQVCFAEQRPLARKIVTAAAEAIASGISPEATQ
jgi:hypothetical protein